MTSAKKIKEALTSRKQKEPVPTKDLLGTGSTLLNLACSGRIQGGWPKGMYVYIVGDSRSLKSWLAMSALAEACANKYFKDYRLIYDNSEDGVLMDIVKFFGKKLAERIEPPAMEDGEFVYSETIEDLYFHIHDAIQVARKTGKPFIYVNDSMDSLSSGYEGKKFDERKEASRGGKKAKGDYGDGKAKYNSGNLRQVLSGIRDTKSILMIISQTRDNIAAGPFEPSQTRSGGRALRFYAAIEIWTKIKKKIKKSIKGKLRHVGNVVNVQVKRSRVTGREPSVDINVYASFGIDDMGSCVNYLVDEGHWKKKDKSPIIKAPEFEFKGTVEKLIKKIEDEGSEKELKLLVSEVWEDIEQASVVKRKPRYS